MQYGNQQQFGGMNQAMQKAQQVANSTWQQVDSDKNGYLDCYEFFACFVLACNNGGYAIPKITVSNGVFNKYTGGQQTMQYQTYVKFLTDYFNQRNQQKGF